MKKNNKGFSLVELIIVIAIMAVLVGVLAPQFIKYVEQSRRSKDIQAAEEIREAVLAAIADGKISGNGSQQVNLGTAPLSVGPGNNIDTIAEVPDIAGNIVSGNTWTVQYNCTSGTCSVFINGTTYELTDEDGASTYKSAS
jgi:type IV pilus assembly protein PilA